VFGMWNRSSRLKMMSSRIDRKRKEMKWRRTDGEKAESWKAVELESCSIKLVYL